MMNIKRTVGIIGSGNWGSAICKIITKNVKLFPDIFNPNVNIWVKEELFNGENLSEIIKTTNQNKKYLPGHLLGNNLNVITDLVEVTQQSDVIIFVLPHQFVDNVCSQMKAHLKKDAISISLIKGLYGISKGKLDYISDHINKTLDISVSVLSGANIANEIADENYSESTLGCLDAKSADLWMKLFSTDYFRIRLVNQIKSIEIYGALKNVVACACGFVLSKECANNTLAAVIRMGTVEINNFINTVLQQDCTQLVLESCGLADVVASSMGGRNTNLSKLFCQCNSTIDELESIHLNGQKLQGPETSRLLHTFLKENNLHETFPLLFNVWSVFTRELSHEKFLKVLFS